MALTRPYLALGVELDTYHILARIVSIQSEIEEEEEEAEEEDCG